MRPLPTTDQSYPRRSFGLFKGACAALALSLITALPGQACSPESVEIKSASGKLRFSVEVADDNLERAQGLMHVESMGRFEGMLFIYDAPLRARFWMKNTLIPLDMIFMDPTGTITHIHENAVPLSEDTIDGGEGVLYVLEINGGLSKRFGIAPGDVLRHPAIAPDIAAWPCAPA